MKRRVHLESLESRRLLAAEGSSVSISQPVDVSGLVGTVSATVNWGDGQSTLATISAQPPNSPLRFRFDYTLDRSGLFSNPAARASLERAGQSVLRFLTDDLDPIIPGGVKQWTARFRDPSTGAESVTATGAVNIAAAVNLRVEANEMVIYVGGRDLVGNQLGEAITGSFFFPGTGPITPAQQTEILAFREDVQFRGETGAAAAAPTDYGPWGGSISFDSSNRNWFFGDDIDAIAPTQSDFFTTASHELLHILGFGLSPSWNRLSNGVTFSGSSSRAAYAALGGSGNVPVEEVKHWGNSILTQLDYQTLMAEAVLEGQRQLITNLDAAALEDIGWRRSASTVRVTANHVYPDNGDFTAQIIVTGTQASEISQSVPFNITNVAPTLTAPAAPNVVAGTPTPLLTWNFTDPGFNNARAIPPTTETFNYTINWGDSTPLTTGVATVTRNGAATVLTQGQFAATHTYANAGSFNVTATITDDDGGSRSTITNLTVAAPPPQPLTAELNLDEVAETAAIGTLSLTIRRPNLNIGAALPIRITANSNRVQFNNSPTIAANATSVIVPITMNNDSIAQVMESITFEVAATNFINASDFVFLLDDENKFQNTGDRFNVSGDGVVTALDALQVINVLNFFNGERDLTNQTANAGDPKWDVNGDYKITAVDALQVINEINRRDSITVRNIQTAALFGLNTQDDETRDTAFAELYTENLLF